MEQSRPDQKVEDTSGGENPPRNLPPHIANLFAGIAAERQKPKSYTLFGRQNEVQKDRDARLNSIAASRDETPPRTEKTPSRPNDKGSKSSDSHLHTHIDELVTHQISIQNGILKKLDIIIDLLRQK
jgi:hypothetical protein